MLYFLWLSALLCLAQVTRLELKQLALPKAALSARGLDRATNQPRPLPPKAALAVAHLCLERRDFTSRHWVRTALLSAPLVAVDPPPVTHQHRRPGSSRSSSKSRSNRSSRSKSNSNGAPGGGVEEFESSDCAWTAWLEGGQYEAWCGDHPHRPRFKYLVPPNQPAVEWRLLWACPDLTNAARNPSRREKDRGFRDGAAAARGGRALLRAVPRLLVPSLGVASVEDLPFLAFGWRARTLRVRFLSPAGQLLPADGGDIGGPASAHAPPSSPLAESGRHRRPPEALAALTATAFGLALALPGATWSRLVAPAVCVDGNVRVEAFDLATLTSACVVSTKDYIRARSRPVW